MDLSGTYRSVSRTVHQDWGLFTITLVRGSYSMDWERTASYYHGDRPYIMSERDVLHRLNDKDYGWVRQYPLTVTLPIGA